MQGRMIVGSARVRKTVDDHGNGHDDGNGHDGPAT
jgi:hypothetical protein